VAAFSKAPKLTRVEQLAQLKRNDEILAKRKSGR
jgi:hypothetical protein